SDASGCAAPPSLADTTWTSTPEATSWAIVAPRPRVSSSGWAATTTRPGHALRSSRGRGRLPRPASHTGAGVPVWVSGLAANLAQLVMGAVAMSLLKVGVPVAAPAQPDPARRGFVVFRWSGRPPAVRGARPDTTVRVPGRARYG